MFAAYVDNGNGWRLETIHDEILRDTKCLKRFENGSTVEDVLCAYFDVTPDQIVKTLKGNNMVEYWAGMVGMSIASLIEWIDASRKFPSKFKVIKESECQMDLGAGGVLKFDWVIDD